VRIGYLSELNFRSARRIPQVSRDPRGGVIQYSKSFPSKNKAGIGVERLYRMRRFDDGVTYIRRVRMNRLEWTLPSSVDFDPGGYEYLELADIVRLSNPSRTTHRRVCPSTRMRAREAPT